MKKFKLKALKLLSLFLILFIAFTANAQYSVDIKNKTVVQAIKVIEKSPITSSFMPIIYQTLIKESALIW